jgi:MscS family membrane protein
MKKLILFVLFALWTQLANAQGLAGVLSGAKSQPPSSSNTAPDPLGRENPRDAIDNFLEACRSGNFIKAARYLDLSKIPASQRTTEGPELARTLSLALDHDTHFEVEHLSSAPDGRRDDGLDSDLDRLYTFALKGHSVPVYLQRISQEGANVWVVSADSVGRIPSLAPLTQASAIEKRMPAALVEHKLLGTSLWAWLALFAAALLLSALSRLLSRLAITIVKPIAKRYVKSVQGSRLEGLTEPMRLLVSVLVFRAVIEIIGPSALLRDYLLKLLALLFVFGSAALVMRLVDLGYDQALSRMDHSQRRLSYSVLPLGVRFVKICIFCLAVLVTLNQWGYNTTTILAGVGVGGLAVALAAQKTIENLFGGVAVISDRPVLVGDVCQFGGQVGTVEDIGLRSTRIRTLDRTVVTVPNSQFSTMTLENYSRRDRMWFHPTLQLRRDTTPEQIRQMMAAVESVLRDRPKVDPTTVPVRFTKISPDAFNLEIFSYVQTSDGDEFNRTQTELLLKILEAARELNINFAVPFQMTEMVPTEEAGSEIEMTRRS